MKKLAVSRVQHQISEGVLRYDYIR